MINKDKKWLFVPIEVKVREFEAKFIFSAIAAKNGFNVLIGSMGKIKKQMQNYPNGIYVSKDMYHLRKNEFQKIKKNGNKIVAWDEEGLLYLNKNIFLRQRVSKETMKFIDKFHSWGNNQTKTILRKVPEFESKIVNSGNPRIDLLRPEFRTIFNKEVNEIYEKYSPYVLINTNFGFANHIKNYNFIINKIEEHSKKFTKKDKNFYDRYYKYNKKIFNKFKNGIIELSNNLSNYKFILRPHPAENIQVWNNVFSNISNVEIIHKGNVIPWIMASELVIHNSCTTGIEAYLLDKPVISYMPETNEEFDMYLPNAISLKTYDEKELIEATKNILNNKNIFFDKSKNKNKIIKKYINSIEGKFASEKIIKDLKNIEVKNNQNPFQSFYKFIKRKYIFYFSSKTKEKIKKMLNLLKIKKYLLNKEIYGKQKFSGIEFSEITQLLRNLNKTSKNFNKLNIKQMGKDLFKLSNKE